MLVDCLKFIIDLIVDLFKYFMEFNVRKDSEALLLDKFVLEILKLLITGLGGFISYRIYQLHKNKKDNSLLYLQLYKLEKEMIENKSTLGLAINEFSELEGLVILFQGSDIGIELYEILKTVHNLNNYYYPEPITDEHGMQIDEEYIYCDKQYYIMGEINSLIGYLNNDEYIDAVSSIRDLENQLEKIENCSIYNEFDKLKVQLESILPKKPQYTDSLRFLYQNLCKFNCRSKSFKQNKLDKFCKYILCNTNELTPLIEVYDKYERLKKQFDTKTQLERLHICFEHWDLNNFDLLMIYDPGVYLELEKFYSKYKSLEIKKADKDQLRILYSLITLELEPVIKTTINKQWKILKKTNRIYNNL